MPRSFSWTLRIHNSSRSLHDTYTCGNVCTLVRLTLSDKSQEHRTRASLLTILLLRPSTDVLRDLRQLRTYPIVYHTRTAPMGRTHPRDLKNVLTCCKHDSNETWQVCRVAAGATVRLTAPSRIQESVHCTMHVDIMYSNSLYSPTLQPVPLSII